MVKQLLAAVALVGLAASMRSPAQAECRWVLVNGHQHAARAAAADVAEPTNAALAEHQLAWCQ